MPPNPHKTLKIVQQWQEPFKVGPNGSEGASKLVENLSCTKFLPNFYKRGPPNRKPKFVPKLSTKFVPKFVPKLVGEGATKSCTKFVHVSWVLISQRLKIKQFNFNDHLLEKTSNVSGRGAIHRFCWPPVDRKTGIVRQSSQFPKNLWNRYVFHDSASDFQIETLKTGGWRTIPHDNGLDSRHH